MKYVYVVPGDPVGGQIYQFNARIRNLPLPFFFYCTESSNSTATSEMFLAVELLDTDEKHYSRCPDALAVDCCDGKYRLSLLVHFWYSPCYPMESMCSILDKQTSSAKADIMERAKSLSLDTLLRLNEID
jgi:fucose 4-O-acetylase-like acetyltransferase